MHVQDRTNVTMSIAIIEWLDRFLSTDKAKAMGLKSRPDVITMCLRDFLLKEMPIREQPTGKNIIIKDKDNKNYLDVDIVSIDEIYCNDCHKNDCEHVVRIRENKTLLRKFKKDNIIQ